MGVRAGFVEMESSRIRYPLLSSILILRFILLGRVGGGEKI